MKDKKGFTLVELLAVIAVLGILVLIAIPNVMKVFKSGKDTTMVTQEANVIDASNTFLEDYCIHRLSSLDATGKDKCNVIVKDFYEENGVTKKYFCLADLVRTGYIPEVRSGEISCAGLIVYDKAKNSNTHSNGKVYLKCGSDGYATDTSDINGYLDNQSCISQ